MKKLKTYLAIFVMVLCTSISTVNICAKSNNTKDVGKILNKNGYTVGYEFHRNYVFAICTENKKLIDFDYYHNSDQLLVTNILYEGLDLQKNKIYDGKYADLKIKTDSTQSKTKLKKQANYSFKKLGISQKELKKYMQKKYNKEYKKYQNTCNKVENILNSNGYQINYAEDMNSMLISYGNTGCGWLYEKYDTLSYMNLDIHSIIIDSFAGDYSRSKIMDSGKDSEDIFNIGNPNFTKEIKEKLYQDQKDRLASLNIKYTDLTKFCWNKLYNSTNDKSQVTTTNKKFTAKGVRPLMRFINCPDRSGYHIANPSRDGNWVTCKIKPVDANDYYNNIKIRYYVEDQKVYCVDVIADNSDIMNTEEFKNACIGMTLALNPDISQEDAISGVTAGLNSDSAIVQNDTQFLKDSSKYTLTISY